MEGGGEWSEGVGMIVLLGEKGLSGLTLLYIHSLGNCS